MSRWTYRGNSRKFIKRYVNRLIRHSETGYENNKLRCYKRFWNESGFSYFGESHNTKPLYKQINRETIRKWGDAA